MCISLVLDYLMDFLVSGKDTGSSVTISNKTTLCPTYYDYFMGEIKMSSKFFMRTHVNSLNGCIVLNFSKNAYESFQLFYDTPTLQRKLCNVI